MKISERTVKRLGEIITGDKGISPYFSMRLTVSTAASPQARSFSPALGEALRWRSSVEMPTPECSEISNSDRRRDGPVRSGGNDVRIEGGPARAAIGLFQAERRHIARELHDSAGQTLAALGMSLGELSKKANGNAALAKSVNSAER